MTHAIDLALPLIMKFEGCILHPYRDAVGVWTIGYGCTYIDGHPVTGATEKLTQDGADALLRMEVEKFAGSVAKLVKPGVALADHEAAALISFAFNLGVSALGGSTLLRKLNAGDRAGASGEFQKWNLAGGKVLAGLVRRRAEERAMFMSDPTTHEGN